MNNLFVYGTLMSGYGRNSIISHLEFIPSVLNDYKRIWPESLGFPFIIKSLGDMVEGELYFDIPDNLWFHLDRIEGEGHLYHRIEVKVIGSNEEKYSAYTYYPSNDLSNRFLKKEKK